MTGTNRQPEPAASDAARDAALLLRATRTATLATIDRATKHPYASLVTTALDADGAPLLLISGLARHTKNLDADPRSSLLIADLASPAADPLTKPRITLVGSFAPTPSPTARASFLTAHPAADGYASFADFRFFKMTLVTSHFIGGFGRIIEVSGAELSRALLAAASK